MSVLMDGDGMIGMDWVNDGLDDGGGVNAVAFGDTVWLWYELVFIEISKIFIFVDVWCSKIESPHGLLFVFTVFMSLEKQLM